ncbi:MAG TPA: CHRD domain-containing protein [Flavitalea sp.]|nr:CHRD domain-containing protein [Flavitalea sp.]
MKKTVLPAIMGVIVALSACNNQAGNESNIELNLDSIRENAKAQADVDKTSLVMKNGLLLNAAQEVPANNSPASGTVNISYNKENRMLSYTVNWDGLTDKPTMAHIHGTAPRGENAGVKHDLTAVIPKEKSGSFSDSVLVDGSVIKEDSLLAGFYYFNIHTPAHPGGEIRCQIEF